MRGSYVPSVVVGEGIPMATGWRGFGHSVSIRRQSVACVGIPTDVSTGDTVGYGFVGIGMVDATSSGVSQDQKGRNG